MSVFVSELRWDGGCESTLRISLFPFSCIWHVVHADSITEDRHELGERQSDGLSTGKGRGEGVEGEEELAKISWKDGEAWKPGSGTLCLYGSCHHHRQEKQREKEKTKFQASPFVGVRIKPSNKNTAHVSSLECVFLEDNLGSLFPQTSLFVECLRFGSLYSPFSVSSFVSPVAFRLT